MHLALRLAVAPCEGEASFHRIVIFFQSESLALKFRDALFLYAFEPLIQACAPWLPQHSGELLDQLIGLGNLRIFLAELGQVALLPPQTLVFFKSDPMSHL
jgi:hypothetical protein